MGARLSRSRNESRKGLGYTKRKRILQLEHGCYVLQKPPSAYYPDEPDYYSLSLSLDCPRNNKCDRTEGPYGASPKRDNEKSAKRNSVPQRMLPSIPGNAEVGDSVRTERIYESVPKLPDIDDLACHRFDGVPQRCSSFDLVDDQGTEAKVLIEEKKAYPSYKLYRGYNYSSTRQLRSPSRSNCYGYPVVTVVPYEPNIWKATVPRDSDRDGDYADPTLIQIDSSTVASIDQSIDQTERCNISSEYNENCFILEEFTNISESEDYASNPVPTQNPSIDWNYPRTDSNLSSDVSVLSDDGYACTTANHLRASVDYSPRPKTQAIVGPTSEYRVHGGVVLYPVQAGTTRTLIGATVEVPITLDLRLGCVEVGWSNNPGEFPVLALGQHPITKVLHCLPHGSTFTLPVVISFSLPVVEGQIEIFYSPTDVGQPPVWTKLRAIDAPENTQFTDNRNFVTLDRDRSIARFELCHFCAFFIVENGRLIEAKKTKASLLLKNEFKSNYCNVVVRVVLGCLEDVAQQKMMEKLQIYQSDGYRVLDDVEFDLVASDLKSMVKVRISQIQWIPDGDVTHGDIGIVEFQLDHLWNQGTVAAMFWQWSRITSGVKPKAFAATVHIQQDNRHDMQTKIFCSLESPLQPLPFNEGQLHVPVNDHWMIVRCSNPKDLSSCAPLHAVPLCSSCSEYKFEVDLHSDNSVPGAKAAVPVENLDRQKKSIETGGAVKL